MGRDESDDNKIRHTLNTEMSNLGKFQHEVYWSGLSIIAWSPCPEIGNGICNSTFERK